MNPIILDRSRLSQYVDCPMQGFLSMLFEAIKAKAEGYEVFPYEAERISVADPALIQQMTAVSKQSIESRLADSGTEIHALFQKAFEECQNDIDRIPEWIVTHLPTVKPNIQPMALRHARHAADMLSEFHVQVISVEQQISVVVYPEKAIEPVMMRMDGTVPMGTPAVIITMRLDLLGNGKGCLHVMDWKTGYKRRTNTETQDSFQAQMAAWLLFQLPEYKDINIVHFWYYETLWGTKSYARFDRNEEHPRLPGLTTEAAIKGRLLSTVDLFLSNNRDVWPLPDTCAWCSMIRFCPFADMDAKTIADDPKAFIDRLAVMTAWVSRQKRAATEWVKAKGAIVGSKISFTRKIPADRFSASFEDNGKPTGPAETGDDSLDDHFS